MSIATISTEYVRVSITETTGKTIDAATVQLALVRSGNPGIDDWNTGEWETEPGTSRIARLLINGQYPAGSYYVWYQFEDTPEKPARQAGTITIT